MTNKDTDFMRRAIELARVSVEHGNEPFGAVLVKGGDIVFESENRIYSEHDFTIHAEHGLIRDFSATTGITDLREYTMYSSCEPCFMCSGAMVWAKLGRLVYGASDIDLCALIGGQGSECSRIVFENSHWKPEVTAGVLRDESLAVLRDYFSCHGKN